MKKKKNKNRKNGNQPLRKAIGIDYKSLLKLLCNKYDDYKNVFEAEHDFPAPPFEVWLSDLRDENNSKREKEKNILKRKISTCIEEAISLVFETYHNEHPNAEVLFYDYVRGVISE